MSQHRHFQSRLPGHLPVIEEERGLVVQLQSAEDVIPVVKLANSTHTPLIPDMGQTHNPAQAVFLDMSHLNGVQDYRNEEFLITAETGMTLDQLEETLDAQDQRMALAYRKNRRLISVVGEAPYSLSATRFGNLHQWVVGLQAVTGDGEPLHYGGAVVKNVTGYDMNKLFIGSHHQFGLVTRVILKVEPKAEMTRSFLFHVENLHQAVDLALRLKWIVSSLEILALFKTKTSFGWQILVTLSGYRDVVHLESEAIHHAITNLKSDLQELYLAPRALEQWTQKLDWTHPDEPDALVLRLALPQKPLLDLPYHFSAYPWLKAADMLMPMDTNQLFLRWISVNMPGADELNILQEQVMKLGGFLEMVRCPANMHLDLADFNADPQPVVREWSRRLKAKFDPNGVLVGRSNRVPAATSQEVLS